MAGEVLSIAFAGKGQHQDAGAKITHNAPNTTSQIISKSISQEGGRASYRGLLKIADGADGVDRPVIDGAGSTSGAGEERTPGCLRRHSDWLRFTRSGNIRGCGSLSSPY